MFISKLIQLVQIAVTGIFTIDRLFGFAASHWMILNRNDRKVRSQRSTGYFSTHAR
jgi:hypothetical protein